MVEWLVPIAVAVIGGPIVALITTLRKENTEQHRESRSLLEHVIIKVDHIDSRLDKHEIEHLKEERRTAV